MIKESGIVERLETHAAFIEKYSGTSGAEKHRSIQIEAGYSVATMREAATLISELQAELADARTCISGMNKDWNKEHARILAAEEDVEPTRRISALQQGAGITG